MFFRDRIVRYLLEGLEAEELETTSETHRKFIVRRIGRTYWTGKRRSVKVGRNVADSVSVSKQMEILMTKWEKDNGHT